MVRAACGHAPLLGLRSALPSETVDRGANAELQTTSCDFRKRDGTLIPERPAIPSFFVALLQNSLPVSFQPGLNPRVGAGLARLTRVRLKMSQGMGRDLATLRTELFPSRRTNEVGAGAGRAKFAPNGRRNRFSRN